MLYVKPLDGRRLLIELLCAQAGGAMGIPCAKPYIVLAEPAHVGLPGSDVLHAFGSEMAGHPAIARPWMDTESLFAMLRAKRLLEPASVFDEWIANTDRHQKQIIVGGKPEVVFIDHEQALAADCKPCDSVSNWLLDQQKVMLDHRQRSELLALVRPHGTAMASVELGGASPHLDLIADGEVILGQLVSFLLARKAMVDRLLCSRLVPEQIDIEDSSSGSL